MTAEILRQIVFEPHSVCCHSPQSLLQSSINSVSSQLWWDKGRKRWPCICICCRVRRWLALVTQCGTRVVRRGGAGTGRGGTVANASVMFAIALRHRFLEEHCETWWCARQLKQSFSCLIIVIRDCWYFCTPQLVEVWLFLQYVHTGYLLAWSLGFCLDFLPAEVKNEAAGHLSCVVEWDVWWPASKILIFLMMAFCSCSTDHSLLPCALVVFFLISSRSFQAWLAPTEFPGNQVTCQVNTDNECDLPLCHEMIAG